jgi:hypothetical protein
VVDIMTTIIHAYRQQPINRPGRVEAVLCKYGIGPRITATLWTPSPEQLQAFEDGRAENDNTEWPANYVSTFSRNEAEDGSEIEIEISLDDDKQAPALISELRMCGFVAGVIARYV